MCICCGKYFDENRRIANLNCSFREVILSQMFYSINIRSKKSLWRNRLARSAVNRKVGGSSPPRDVYFDIIRYSFAAASILMKTSILKSYC